VTRAESAHRLEGAPLPDEPHVSVVIPCFNYGRFLAEAISSALGQSHVPFEVIVVDDGSTDSSVDVAGNFAPHVRVITQQNMGVAAARNLGLREAAGEYVTFLDADDVFQPTYVEALLTALLEGSGAAYAYSSMEYFGAARGAFPAFAFSPALLLARNFVNTSALVRRSDALAIGGFTLSFQRSGWEDWDFFLRLLEHDKQGVAVSKPLLRYRQHEISRRSPRSRNLRERLRLQSEHPSLYGRRPRVVRETLILATLAASVLRCGRCLRVLDRAWGFQPDRL
jgi:glycosyltransferase involved in cell wall biosynthesis